MLTETNFLTASTVARGRSLLGERGEELDTLVVHPSVAYYLYQVGMLTFSTSALSTGTGIQLGVAVVLVLLIEVLVSLLV